MVSMVALPMGAGIGDSRGRKPVIVFSFMMGLFGLICNTMESTDYFIKIDPNALLLYAAGVASGLGSANGPVRTFCYIQNDDLIPQLRCVILTQ